MSPNSTEKTCVDVLDTLYPLSLDAAGLPHIPLKLVNLKIADQKKAQHSSWLANPIFKEVTPPYNTSDHGGSVTHDLQVSSLDTVGRGPVMDPHPHQTMEDRVSICIYKGARWSKEQLINEQALPAPLETLRNLTVLIMFPQMVSL